MRYLIISLFVSMVSVSAYAHPDKCQHTHNPDGTITWESGCGR